MPTTLKKQTFNKKSKKTVRIALKKKHSTGSQRK